MTKFHGAKGSKRKDKKKRKASRCSRKPAKPARPSFDPNSSPFAIPVSKTLARPTRRRLKRIPATFDYHTAISTVLYEKNGGTRLLSLPSELRDAIWKLVVVHKNPIHIDVEYRYHDINITQPAITRVCTQTRTETLSSFYELNCFRFHFFHKRTKSCRISLGHVGRYADHLRRVEIQGTARENYIRLTLSKDPADPSTLHVKGDVVIEKNAARYYPDYLDELRCVYHWKLSFAFMFLDVQQAAGVRGVPLRDLMELLAKSWDAHSTNIPHWHHVASCWFRETRGKSRLTQLEGGLRIRLTI
jgi:hypothetical protein